MADWTWWRRAATEGGRAGRGTVDAASTGGPSADPREPMATAARPATDAAGADDGSPGPRRGTPPLGPADRHVQALLEEHGPFARSIAAAALRRRDGRHRSITGSELAHDVILLAAGLDAAGRRRPGGRAEAAADAAGDRRRMRRRIRRLLRWRLDERERLARVRLRRDAVDVHETFGLADRRASDPARAALLREHLRRRGRPGSGERARDEVATPPATSAKAAESPATPAAAAPLHADEAPADATAVLHAFARDEARSDPTAARRLALHLLVDRLGIPVATATKALGTPRSTAYRDLDAIRARLAVPGAGGT